MQRELDELLERLRPLRLLPYQLRALRRTERFTWNNWSRQVGKSFTFSLRRVLRGLWRRRDQLLLSAGERQSRELMLKVRQHCERIGLACEIEGEPFARGARYQRLETRLPNGARILALPANPLTARGYTADVFLDEFAMHRDDAAIWAALLPTLLRDDGELDIASTPRGRGNIFCKLAENPRFAHSTVTLLDATAEGLEVDVDEMRAALSDERIFRQEFMCEFDVDDEALLPYEVITGCFEPGLSKLPDRARLQRREVEAYGGVDIGRRHDRTVIWLWERQMERFVTRGVVEMHRCPFAEQLAVLGEFMALPALRRVCIDATGMGMMMAEEVVRRYRAHRAEAVMMTAGVQDALASRLRVAAEERRLRIPADEAIAADWHALRRVRTASGHCRYVAERSRQGHSDRFWAAALGLHAAGEPPARGPIALFAEQLSFAGAGTL